MKCRTFSHVAAAAAVAIGVAGPGIGPGGAQAAVVLQFDYSFDTNGFFNDPTRRATLEGAGRVFSERFLDDLSAITPDANNSWTAQIFHPATGATTGISNPTIPANTIRIYAGGRDLGSPTLGIGGPGGYSASGFQPFFDTLNSRGEPGALQSPPTDFGPWGGSITFDTNGPNWNFNLNAGPSGGQSDFYSVAVHELAHLLGFGLAESFDARINGANQFTGPRSVAAFGGPVPLSPDQGHWATSTQSTVGGTAQQAVMTPAILVGTRKRFTVLDFAGMDDIGWDLARPGDANADGSVNGTDFALLAGNFGTTGRTWASGDFNYDGAVNGTDFALLAANFGTTGAQSVAVANSAAAPSAADWDALQAFGEGIGMPVTAPEPGACGVAIMAAGLLASRRRRRKRE